MLTRRTKIILSIAVLLIAFLLATLNLDGKIAAVSLAVALLALHGLIASSDGLYTSYLEVLNSDLPGAIYALKTLFSAAERSIKIVSGQLSPIVYFNPEVYGALEEAVTRGVSVQIILAEPDAKLEDLQNHIDSAMWKQFVQLKEKGGISIRQVRRRARPHFIVVDDTHLRIEDLHPKRLRLDVDEERRATTVYFDENVECYTKRFAALVPQSDPV